MLKLTKWTDDQLPACVARASARRALRAMHARRWCNGLASGMRVRLDGLKAKPELNGQVRCNVVIAMYYC